MKTIEILGGGCAKCRQLHANAELAAKALNLEYRIGKITDMREIAMRGVMATPALAIDGAVVSSGRVLTADQIKALLR